MLLLLSKLMSDCAYIPLINVLHTVVRLTTLVEAHWIEYGASPEDPEHPGSAANLQGNVFFLDVRYNKLVHSLSTKTEPITAFCSIPLFIRLLKVGHCISEEARNKEFPIEELNEMTFVHSSSR